MTKQELQDFLQELFIETFKLNRDDMDFEKKIEDYEGIDSIGVIEFVVRIEESLNIEFEDEMLSDENLSSLRVICDLLYEKYEDLKLEK